VYDVQAAASPAVSTRRVTESSLENARYSIKLAQTGDVTSIFDKTLNKELLPALMRLVIITDNPRNWPAWNSSGPTIRKSGFTSVFSSMSGTRTISRPSATLNRFWIGSPDTVT